jgi:hypothetical protein
LGDAAAEGGGFFEGAEGGPESGFEGLGLFIDHAVGGVSVTDVAAELEAFAVGEFPDGAAALRAGETGGGTGEFFRDEGVGTLFSDIGWRSLSVVHVGFLDRLADEPDEECGDFFGACDVIDFDVAECTGGHAGEVGVGGVLDDGDAAGFFDVGEAEGAVVEAAGEDDADDLGTFCLRRSAEEGINGGAEAVFLGAAGEADGVVADDEVVVRGRDIDMAIFEFSAVFDGLDDDAAGAGEEFGEDAAAGGSGVEDDADSGGEVVGEAGDDAEEDFDAPGGSAHDDEVWKQRH